MTIQFWGNHQSIAVSWFRVNLKHSSKSQGHHHCSYVLLTVPQLHSPPHLALARGKQTYSTAPLWLWLGGQTSNPKSVSMYFWQPVRFTPPLCLWLGGNKPNPAPPSGSGSGDRHLTLNLLVCTSDSLSASSPSDWLGGNAHYPRAPSGSGSGDRHLILRGGRGIHSLELISCWFIMAGGMNFRD